MKDILNAIRVVLGMVFCADIFLPVLYCNKWAGMNLFLLEKLLKFGTNELGSNNLLFQSFSPFMIAHLI